MTHRCSRGLPALLAVLVALAVEAAPGADAGSVVDPELLLSQTLLEGGPTRERVDKLSELLASPDAELRGRACVAAALLGAAEAPAVARTLLKGAAPTAVALGGHCLALTRAKDAAATIAARLEVADQNLRNDLGVLLALFRDHPAAAAPLARLIRKQRRSHISFNVLSWVEGWTSPLLVEAVVAHAEAATAADASYNREGVLQLLVGRASLDETQLSLLRSLLEKKSAPRLLLSLEALAPVPGERRPKELRVLLEGYLRRKDVPGYQRNGIANALVSFHDAATVKAYAAAMESCEDVDCEDLVWSAAAFPGAEARALVDAARTHSDSPTARAARVVQQYFALADRGAEALRLLEEPVVRGGKVDFDGYSERNDVLVLAARDPSGLTREELLRILTRFQSSHSLDWFDLTRAYLVRFGNPDDVAELYVALGDYQLGREQLNRFIAANPSPPGCGAMLQVAVRRRLEPEALLPLVRARISGACP